MPLIRGGNVAKDPITVQDIANAVELWGHGERLKSPVTAWYGPKDFKPETPFTMNITLFGGEGFTSGAILHLKKMGYTVIERGTEYRADGDFVYSREIPLNECKVSN